VPLRKRSGFFIAQIYEYGGDSLSTIKRLRLSKGISQRQLAQDAGVCQSLLCAVETGRMIIWPAMAKRLARALKVNVSDLCATIKGGDRVGS